MAEKVQRQTYGCMSAVCLYLVMYCIVLYCAVLCCTVLYYNVLHCTVLLQVTIWGDYGRVEGTKVFMGVAQILLDNLDLSHIVIGWYCTVPLCTFICTVLNFTILFCTVLTVLYCTAAGTNCSAPPR